KDYEGGPNLIEEMDKAVEAQMSGQEYGVVTNKDNDVQDGQRMPFDSRGMNKYTHLKAIYFKAALNRQPYHIKLLHGLGFENDTLFKSTAVETAYQTIMRTSLRDPSSEDTVTAIVPDLPMAMEIGAILRATDIQQLPLPKELLPAPRLSPLLEAQKKARYR